ncbi:MAG TPA: hypothetical protein VEL74_10965, partial [Thermoanaerobaculia bacterium]|nr:hypothetical protein [Thermoanaerobaculia bacterium]
MCGISGPVRVGGWFACLACLVLAAAPAAASQVSLVSRAEPTLPNDAGIGFGAGRPSSDGRFVVFLSAEAHLVPGQVDTNRTTDVFLRDRATGTTVLVSRSATSPTTAANDSSTAPVLSADGRYVAFSSLATDLVAGQTDNNFLADLFLFDRVTGTVTLVSHAASSPATTGNHTAGGAVSLSADGAYIAFTSPAGNLVAGQGGGAGVQVFLYDRAAGTNRLVSHAAGSATFASAAGADRPTLSADGRWVVYESGSEDLVAGSDLPATAVFLFDRTTGTNILVSRSSGSMTQGGDGASTSPRISADGLWVAFQSTASNLVAGVTGSSSQDIFLWERQTGAMTLVTHDASSASTEAGVFSFLAGISADGGRVLFSALSTNLVPGQSGPAGLTKIFLFDRATGANTLVNHAAGSPAAVADQGDFRAFLSGDGRFVAFTTSARNILPGAPETNLDDDVFLYDHAGGGTSLASRVAGTAAAYPQGNSVGSGISDGGEHIVFVSTVANLASGVRDFNGIEDVYTHDRVAGTAELVSRLASPSLSAGAFTDSTDLPTLTSTDGRWVVFTSSAPNLVPGQVEDEAAPGATRDVFLHDRATGTTLLVSRKAGATPATAASNSSSNPVISADGRWVAFQSLAEDLVADQAQSWTDYFNVFLYDRDTGIITLLSHAAGLPSTSANNHSGLPSISADGSRILFRSLATDLGATDGNGMSDLFLYDRAAGTRTLISHAAGAPATTANGPSTYGRLSADGAFIVFTSWASDLLAGQTDPSYSEDVFLHQIAAGTTTLVSHIPGSATTVAAGDSRQPVISADGAVVAFESFAGDLVAGQTDTNGGYDVFLFARATGVVTLVSRASGSATTTGDASSWQPVLSADGAWLAFHSFASNLVAGQVAGLSTFEGDVFLHERATGQTRLMSHAPGAPLVAAAS